MEIEPIFSDYKLIFLNLYHFQDRNNKKLNACPTDSLLIPEGALHIDLLDDFSHTMMCQNAQKCKIKISFKGFQFTFLAVLYQQN